MPEDISIREPRGSNQAARVAPIKRMETELVLEDVLTANPELIAPDFTLVGRQTPVDGGSLDLLGVDGDGRLVVLQLKRAKLTREAVAQIIDYGPTRSGITFSLPTITVAGQNVRSSHSVTLLDRGRIRVTFLPIAVHLCQQRFEREQAVLPFEIRMTPNAPSIAEVSQQWACVIDEETSETHRD